MEAENNHLSNNLLFLSNYKIIYLANIHNIMPRWIISLKLSFHFHFVKLRMHSLLTSDHKTKKPFTNHPNKVCGNFVAKRKISKDFPETLPALVLLFAATRPCLLLIFSQALIEYTDILVCICVCSNPMSINAFC